VTQAVTPIPVDARTPDWPRKVANVLNRLQNTTALAGGTAAWGSITGTLSGQTDLQTALNAKQGLDATLTALAAYNTNGLFTQTAADTFTGRTITAGSAKVSVTNGSGVAGNPTVDLGAVASTDLSDSAGLARLAGATFSGAVDVQALLRCDSFRIDQTPTAEVVVCTHTIVVSVDGTDYKIPCVTA
jgi:hypothetical protein